MTDEFEFETMPVIDLDLYLRSGNQTEAARAECVKVAECFHRYGILLVKDPRVDMADNEDYIDLMEAYFAQAGAKYDNGEPVAEVKPECHYQVGATPECIEMARDHSRLLTQELRLPEQDMPMSPLTPTLDAKWRYMWKIGARPAGAADDFPQVVPSEFADWESKMDTWGGKLHSAIFTVAEMAAVGMGLDPAAFTGRMEGGAHLLAPTGSDLEKNDVGTVFAGFHYDISFMTIHGKSRYPGLFVWTRDWKKKAVKIPEGCLLI